MLQGLLFHVSEIEIEESEEPVKIVVPAAEELFLLRHAKLRDSIAEEDKKKYKIGVSFSGNCIRRISEGEGRFTLSIVLLKNEHRCDEDDVITVTYTHFPGGEETEIVQELTVITDLGVG